MKKPSVGRIVHYVSRGSADGKYPAVCRAAVVAAVDEPGPRGYEGQGTSIQAVVLNPEGIFFGRMQYNENNEPGTWHWPEYVE